MSGKNFLTVILGIPIDEDGRFLLSQRNAPTVFDVHLKWQLVGGTMEFGEKAEETLHREFLEEVGRDVELLFPYPLVRTNTWLRSKQHNSPDKHVTLITYLVKIAPGPLDFSKDDETLDARWFTFEEAIKLDALPYTEELIREAEHIRKTYLA